LAIIVHVLWRTQEELMDQEAEQNRPECYGVLQRVFPMGDSGLREVPGDCWDCPHRVQCLRLAISRGEQAETLDQETTSRRDGPGLGGFLKRWSRRKLSPPKE
jgi:hypothetical protein